MRTAHISETQGQTCDKNYSVNLDVDGESSFYLRREKGIKHLVKVGVTLSRETNTNILPQWLIIPPEGSSRQFTAPSKRRSSREILHYLLVSADHEFAHIEYTALSHFNRKRYIWLSFLNPEFQHFDLNNCTRSITAVYCVIS